MKSEPAKKYGFVFLLFLIMFVSLFSSCSRSLGYGVLLWSTSDPPIPSGTILPVYIRSNINQIWVVGIPKQFRNKETKTNKFEIPLAKLTLAGSKKKARRMAEEFAPYSLSYAETLQDGLPIRDNPDNSSRRVYRLRQGEIIKVLSPARGTPAIGGSGDPLPGEWLKVLTESGTTGYCFSYRLALFEYNKGEIVSAPRDAVEDPELDRLLSRNWVAETYGIMINRARINLDELSRRWGFDPGLDTGIARIHTKETDKSFSYTSIRSTGTRSWRFEGAPLQMSLRSDTTLAVQFTESGGALRTILFVTLPTSIDDIIVQETARREELFNIIYSRGPAYASHNYGTLAFLEGGRFNWTDYELLIPELIPASAIGSGHVEIKFFLSDLMSSRYDGVFTLGFNGADDSTTELDFMYTLDSQEFRLEYVPETSRDGIMVNRRSSSPVVLYFNVPQVSVFSVPEVFPFTKEENEPVTGGDFDAFYYNYFFDDNDSFSGVDNSFEDNSFPDEDSILMGEDLPFAEEYY
ncbi:MAG: SH3 domain-containing protein [Treponema sp.]|jgi:hypothetical protein|nr:SH3 domain-containing protein [Treponema sp.]